MTVTNYYSVGGEILGEKTTGGSRIDYLTDALGSVTATLNQSAQVVNTYRYKPYGSLLTKTGTGVDPAFGWNGTHGYRPTIRKFSDFYVRARHYDSGTGRWSTEDLSLLHAFFNKFEYCMNSPAYFTDPSGQEAKGTVPNCCVNNTPGLISAGKCNSNAVRLNVHDPRYQCWKDRCTVCSNGQNSNGLEQAVQEISTLFTGYGQYRCWEVQQCIGGCPDATSKKNGCWSPQGDPSFSAGIQTGATGPPGACCIQVGIDLCCLYAVQIKWAKTQACQLGDCKNSDSGLPPYKKNPVDPVTIAIPIVPRIRVPFPQCLANLIGRYGTGSKPM